MEDDSTLRALAHDLALASHRPEEQILGTLREMDREAAEWHRTHPDDTGNDR